MQESRGDEQTKDAFNGATTREPPASGKSPSLCRLHLQLPSPSPAVYIPPSPSPVTFIECHALRLPSPQEKSNFISTIIFVNPNSRCSLHRKFEIRNRGSRQEQGKFDREPPVVALLEPSPFVPFLPS